MKANLLACLFLLPLVLGCNPRTQSQGELNPSEANGAATRVPSNSDPFGEDSGQVERALFEELKEKAQNGDLESQWKLIMFSLAAGIELPAQQNEDDRKFFTENKIKAEDGGAMPQWVLGLCYRTGFGVEKDLALALNWFRKAAEQGLASAEFDLGLCYAKGEGVPNDFTASVKWFRKAAEQGFVAAQYGLGLCYDRGDGVIKDSTEAAKWYRQAADQGHDQAQHNLSILYAYGEGVTKDSVESAKWCRKAAEQGLASAQYNLGACSFTGDGVPKDPVQAHKWINLALAQGVTMDRQILSVVERTMTSKQIDEARRLAAEFKPHRKFKTGVAIIGSSAIDFPASNSGTGFFISVDGFLISNAHVVERAAQVRLLTSAGLISAKVVKVDAANDLALLKAEGRFAALPVAASRGVKLGGTVATVGFPNIGLQGFAPKLAKGEIASLSGAEDDTRYFQISVPVQPGNSGGALVDERGNVVGVVSAKLSARAALASSGALPENVNYAVKSSYLLSFLESVPEVSAKLKEPETKERRFDEVVEAAEQAAVLVLVY